MVEWGLTRYKDNASLVDAILNIRYLDGLTNLNDALYLTRTRVFAPGRGTRSNALKATIIVTDGKDNVRPGLTLSNATRCKNDGIRLMAVGVSRSVKWPWLLQIASSSSDCYAVDDFNALESIVDKLRTTICEISPSRLSDLIHYYIHIGWFIATVHNRKILENCTSDTIFIAFTRKKHRSDFRLVICISLTLYVTVTYQVTYQVQPHLNRTRRN